MQKAEKRLASILQKFKNSDLPNNKLLELDVIVALKSNKSKKQNKFRFFNNKIYIFISIVLLLCFVVKYGKFNNSECLIDMPVDTTKLFREPEDCKFCENVATVLKLSNISSHKFHKKFADLSKPLIVIDGAKSWPALNLLNFTFFKNLYETIEADTDLTSNCQFFPYKTEFKSLYEVFNMNEKRARLENGEEPWYVGWSNCNDEAGKILKKYYSIPYFLSNTSENLALSWIFMGGPGFGAHMHVDNVQYPSWQAQLKGKKLWRLAPPPECIYKCQGMQAIVEPGEIIVLDTNKWYHQTIVLPGEISITIGSEFD